MIQPYTEDDLEHGRAIVRQLHGAGDFDGWAECIAKNIAAERQKILSAQSAEIARLREALEPFAKWAPVLDGMPDHGSIIATYEINQSEYPNISSVRRARAALEMKG